MVAALPPLAHHSFAAEYVEAFCAKEGSTTANSRSVTLTDGRKVFAGSADDGGPKTRE